MWPVPPVWHVWPVWPVAGNAVSNFRAFYNNIAVCALLDAKTERSMKATFGLCGLLRACVARPGLCGLLRACVARPWPVWPVERLRLACVASISPAFGLCGLQNACV